MSESTTLLTPAVPADSTHPWSDAYRVLSPLRRAALWYAVVEGEGPQALAARLDRPEDTLAELVSSTVVAFRREVALGAGTGYDEDCRAVLRAVDTPTLVIARAERRELATHADTCPDCAGAVGELLELDARLRDGLVSLTLGGAAGPQQGRRPRTWFDSLVDGGSAPKERAATPPVIPAPRAADQPSGSPDLEAFTAADPESTESAESAAGADVWAAAFAELSLSRRTALFHGVVAAEPLAELADRLGRDEDSARDLTVSSLAAFHHTVLRRLPVGDDAACHDLVAHRRYADPAPLTRAQRRELSAHGQRCADCAPAVAEILALDSDLRPRLAAVVLAGTTVDAGAAWLATRPLRGWVDVAPTGAAGRRGRWVLGTAAVATAAAALVGLGTLDLGGSPSSTVVAAEPALAPVVGTSSISGSDQGAVAQRPTPKPQRVVEAPAPILAVAAPSAAASQQPASAPASSTGGTAGQPSGGADHAGNHSGNNGGNNGGSSGGDGGNGGDPGTPSDDPSPLDISVDQDTGSVTVTIGLLGDPIEISTPPLPLVP